jgi:hypothetical protein
LVQFLESLYVEGLDWAATGTRVGSRPVIGWLVDTNVIASLIAPNGTPSVKGWARAADESRLFSAS